MKKTIILIACTTVSVLFIFPMAFLSGSWHSCGFVSEPQLKKDDGIFQAVGRGLAWQMIAGGLIQYQITPLSLRIGDENRIPFFSVFVGNRFLIRCENTWGYIRILSPRKIAIDKVIFQRGNAPLE